MSTWALEMGMIWPLIFFLLFLSSSLPLDRTYTNLIEEHTNGVTPIGRKIFSPFLERSTRCSGLMITTVGHRVMLSEQNLSDVQS